MIQTNTRERRLVIFALIFGLLAIVQLGIIRPAFQKMRRIDTKLRLSAASLRQMQAAILRQGQVESAYEAIRTRITSNKKPEQEIMEILLLVQKAAQDAGVEILENGHTKDEPFTHFKVHTVQFRGSGDAPKLMTMIYGLQDPQLLLKIPEMEFSIKNFKLEMRLTIMRVVYEAGQNG